MVTGLVAEKSSFGRFSWLPWELLVLFFCQIRLSMTKVFKNVLTCILTSFLKTKGKFKGVFTAKEKNKAK